jgi:hypothetical protein
VTGWRRRSRRSRWNMEGLPPRFHAIHDVADVLPTAFAAPALALRAAAGAGPQPSGRARSRPRGRP